MLNIEDGYMSVKMLKSGQKCSFLCLISFNRQLYGMIFLTL